MKNFRKNYLCRHGIAALLLLLIFSAAFYGCDPSETDPGCGQEPPAVSERLPVVFVHGMAGSADQFQTQALRFASNGYPAELISGFEYDTTMANNTAEEIMTRLDAHIDAVLAQTGAEKVDLAGHSMGTMMSQRYLNSSAARAAKVAHYVNIDGLSRRQLPGSVPTLAIWAAMTGENREFTGAENVTLAGQTHVQAATSAESFTAMYTFFTGESAATLDIASEDSGKIQLRGKVITFLTNVIPKGYTLDLFEIDGDTGGRINETPIYSQAIGADGAFEITDAHAGKNYEFQLRPGSGDQQICHFYFEPFIRSDYMIRLKVSAPDSELATLAETSPNQTNLTIVRNKEFVGNAENFSNKAPLTNDSLTINGQELCTPEITPAGNSTIGLYVYDAGTDGRSDLSQGIEGFASIPFVNGADLFIPASDSAEGTVSIVVKGRQNGGLTQVINVPSRPSDSDKISVQFFDF